MSLLQSIHNRQRGAAMTEFALLVPVMITMWMGIEYFRSGYARRLDALARSQTQAWTLAYSNDMSCYRGGLNTGGLAGIGANLSGGGSTADQAISTFSSSGSSSAFLYGDARGDKNPGYQNRRLGSDQGNRARPHHRGLRRSCSRSDPG